MAEQEIFGQGNFDGGYEKLLKNLLESIERWLKQ